MSRRSLGGVVAVLILAAVTVAASLVAYLAVIGLVKAPTTSEATEIPLVIEAVYTSGSTITVYVRNLGSSTAIIPAVYIISSETRSVTYTATNIAVSIPPKEIRAITFTVDEPLKGYYLIKVSSSKATTAMTQYIEVVPIAQGGVDTFKVKACNEDPEPGFLIEKLDGNIFEVS
ncbi:MAG: hypothetical protein J7L98_05715 [Candidatus Verstraetearchaeota archaeon]|nr:hypothetical protein [Candidatus Verstraetearchaeota archaeon]